MYLTCRNLVSVARKIERIYKIGFVELLCVVFSSHNFVSWSV